MTWPYSASSSRIASRSSSVSIAVVPPAWSDLAQRPQPRDRLLDARPDGRQRDAEFVVGTRRVDQGRGVATLGHRAHRADVAGQLRQGDIADPVADAGGRA